MKARSCSHSSLTYRMRLSSGVFSRSAMGCRFTTSRALCCSSSSLISRNSSAERPSTWEQCVRRFLPCPLVAIGGQPGDQPGARLRRIAQLRRAPPCRRATDGRFWAAPSRRCSRWDAATPAPPLAQKGEVASEYLTTGSSGPESVIHPTRFTGMPCHTLTDSTELGTPLHGERMGEEHVLGGHDVPDAPEVSSWAPPACRATTPDTSTAPWPPCAKSRGSPACAGRSRASTFSKARTSSQ